MLTSREIQARLLREKYDEVIVANLRSYPKMLKQAPNGQKSKERYDKWYAGNPKPTISLFPPTSSNGFMMFTNKMNQLANKEPPESRVAECSNFAYHAMGVLLDDPEIRAQYNIVLVNIGYLHSIAVLLPFNHEIPNKIDKNYKLPAGSLIVDPWIVGMGFEPKYSLAVEPENYSMKSGLYNKFEVIYQSKLDPTVAQLPQKKTLTPFSMTLSPQPVFYPKVFFPASYSKMWSNAQKEAQNSGKHDDEITMTQVKKILNDYTKDNSWLKRVCTFHWNRHHIKEVNDIVVKMNKGVLKTPQEVLQELEKIQNISDSNPEGSLQRRFNFIKKQVEEGTKSQQHKI